MLVCFYFNLRFPLRGRVISRNLLKLMYIIWQTWHMSTAYWPHITTCLVFVMTPPPSSFCMPPYADHPLSPLFTCIARVVGVKIAGMGSGCGGLLVNVQTVGISKEEELATGHKSSQLVERDRSSAEAKGKWGLGGVGGWPPWMVASKVFRGRGGEKRTDSGLSDSLIAHLDSFTLWWDILEYLASWATRPCVRCVAQTRASGQVGASQTWTRILYQSTSVRSIFLCSLHWCW